MKDLKGLMMFFVVVVFSSHVSGQKIDFISELDRLYNIKMLPSYMDRSVVKQFSSYDRTGGNNDGFEGTYSYIRKNEDGSLVVFETEGKGVIERLWTPTPTEDTLDFYLDGNTVPDFSIKFNDLFTGKVYPFITPLVGQHFVGGYYSYLPIPYNKGCKIVFRGQKMLFYQFQYREYDPGYEVKTFNPLKITPEEDRELNKLVKLWNYENRDAKSFFGQDLQVIPTVFTLRPGASVTLADIRKGGRILGIEMDPADAFSGLHKQIDIKITWDDEKVPALYAPVADVFGYAFGTPSMRSLLMGVKYSGTAYCYLPMPFDRSAKIELVYRKGLADEMPVNIKAKVFYKYDVREASKEGKLYTSWKREKPAAGKPFTFLKGEGKGHYVGTILHSQATDFVTFTEFFEGDDSTVIDGKMTIHGTGSEDYFNGGWYAQPGGWVEKLGAQLHGCLDYSLPLSRTGGYRFFVSDKMPFNQSIRHNIEHGPVNNNREVDYISLAMYYAEAPVQSSMIPSNDLSQVLIPDTYTFYTGLMDFISYNKDVSRIHGKGEYNGMDAEIKIDVEELPEGKYKVFLYVVEFSGKEIEAGVKQKDGKIKWTKIRNVKAGSDILIGMGEVLNTKTPVGIFLRSDQESKLIFERVLFKK